MLDVNAIYNKTEAGIAEVKSRALGLRAELRRLLILVDGSSPISRLATFVRGAEIAALIFELETQGLITCPAANGYRKTEAGVAEVQKRALGLRAELRRLLILVDGRTPLARLASFVPGLDITVLIAELESSGLVVPPNTVTKPVASVAKISVAAVAAGAAGAAAAASAHTDPAAAPADAVAMPEAVPVEPVYVAYVVTEAHLLAVRSGATLSLQRILGVKTHELLDKLIPPVDSLELRAAIAEIHQSLEEEFGVEIGQHFLDGVRSAAAASRESAA